MDKKIRRSSSPFYSSNVVSKKLTSVKNNLSFCLSDSSYIKNANNNNAQINEPLIKNVFNEHNTIENEILLNKIMLYVKNEINQLRDSLDCKLKSFKQFTNIQYDDYPFVYNELSSPLQNQLFLSKIEKMIEDKLSYQMPKYANVNVYNPNPCVLTESKAEFIENMHSIFLTKKKFESELNNINHKLKNAEEMVLKFSKKQIFNGNFIENQLTTSTINPHFIPTPTIASVYLLKFKSLQKTLSNTESIFSTKIKYYSDQVETFKFEIKQAIENINSKIDKLNLDLKNKEDLILNLKNSQFSIENKKILEQLKKYENEFNFRDAQTGCRIGIFERKVENNFNLLFTDNNRLKEIVGDKCNKSELTALKEKYEEKLMNLKNELSTEMNNKLDVSFISKTNVEIINCKQEIEIINEQIQSHINRFSNYEYNMKLILNSVKQLMTLYNSCLSKLTFRRPKSPKKTDQPETLTPNYFILTEMQNDLKLLQNKIIGLEISAQQSDNFIKSEEFHKFEDRINLKLNEYLENLPIILSDYVTKDIFDTKFQHLKKQNQIHKIEYSKLLLLHCFYQMKSTCNTFADYFKETFYAVKNNINKITQFSFTFVNITMLKYIYDKVEYAVKNIEKLKKENSCINL